MSTTTTHNIRPGMTVRRFQSDPFRTVASVDLDGTAGRGDNLRLFYNVRYEGGGSEQAEAAEGWETS